MDSDLQGCDDLDLVDDTPAQADPADIDSDAAPPEVVDCDAINDTCPNMPGNDPFRECLLNNQHVLRLFSVRELHGLPVRHLCDDIHSRTNPEDAGASAHVPRDCTHIAVIRRFRRLEPLLESQAEPSCCDFENNPWHGISQNTFG